LNPLSEIFEYIESNTALGTVIGILVVAIVSLVIYKIVTHIFNKLNHSNKTVMTHLNFLEKIIKAAVVILAIFGMIVQIDPLRQFAISILASSGIVMVVLSFAAQEAMSNIVNGMFISIFKPFAIGDRVRIDSHNQAGIVEDITLRHTVIRTAENNRVIIPNSIMSSSILENFNYSEDNTCTYLDIGIGYDADIDKAMKIISEVVAAHPSHHDVRTPEQKAAGDPLVRVRLINFGASSVDLRAYIWTKTFTDGYNAACDMRYSIKKRFDEEGIEIPYNYQNIIIKKESDLSDLSAQ